MSIKRPFSEGKCAIKRQLSNGLFTFRESSFFYLSALLVKIQCSASLLVYCTQLHQMHTLTLALQKWSHATWKLSIDTSAYSIYMYIAHTVYKSHPLGEVLQCFKHSSMVKIGNTIGELLRIILGMSLFCFLTQEVEERFFLVFPSSFIILGVGQSLSGYELNVSIV